MKAKNIFYILCIFFVGTFASCKSRKDAASNTKNEQSRQLKVNGFDSLPRGNRSPESLEMLETVMARSNVLDISENGVFRVDLNLIEDIAVAAKEANFKVKTLTPMSAATIHFEYQLVDYSSKIIGFELLPRKGRTVQSFEKLEEALVMAGVKSISNDSEFSMNVTHFKSVSPAATSAGFNLIQLNSQNVGTSMFTYKFVDVLDN